MKVRIRSTSFRCSRCSSVAPADLTRRGCGLPRGWEHRDPKACRLCVWTSGPQPAAELAQPVCGPCVGQLLDELLAAMRTAWAR